MSKQENKFCLGNRVKFSIKSQGVKDRGHRKCVDTEITPIEGIITGVSCIKEGYADKDYDNYDNVFRYFVENKSIKVYRVSINLVKHFLVKPKNLTLVK